MHFPESQRVLYQRNPLAEVICQLRFQRILRIDSELPTAFQERIGRSKYPAITESGTVGGAAVPTEVARLVGFDPATMPSRAFDFVSEDGSWKVSLTSQFVALTALKYISWQDFKSRLEPIVQALEEVYSPGYFTRVGLRYRDLLERTKLGLDSHPWRDLLSPHLLGDLSVAGFEEASEHCAREIVLRLDHHDARVRLYHGFAKRQGSDEICYLVDADFFSEQRAETTNAGTVLDQFNREAGHLFRWCISEQLHQALGPQDPV